jgi:hypothetical protein
METSRSMSVRHGVLLLWEQERTRLIRPAGPLNFRHSKAFSCRRFFLGQCGVSLEIGSFPEFTVCGRGVDRHFETMGLKRAAL